MVAKQKNTKKRKSLEPLKVRLKVWDYTQRYQMLGKSRRWSEVASLAAAREYAAANGYSGIKITPV